MKDSTLTLHPRSRRGSVYIVTCIDPFTKWAEAFPAPNKEAATVARIIVEQIICRFGCPIAILSDQGKEVDGNLMAEICRILDIDIRQVAHEHIQADNKRGCRTTAPNAEQHHG